MRINHNLPALNSYRNLNNATTQNAKSMEKLSSGLRINRAADDAAGLAISETMRSQIRGLNQASRNSQDAISLLQTAEGGLTESHSVLHRMRELAVQAANATYTANDRLEMQKEVDQLKEEIDRIANTTSFNNKNLLDGTASAITSSDKVSTQVIMRGSLRVVDQFGIKTAGGGSYQLDISATAGDAQIQKSNMFKINHAGDSIQNLSIDSNSGIEHLTGSDLAQGSYQIITSDNVLVTALASVVASAISGQYYAASGSTAGRMFTTTMTTTGTTINASVMIEVSAVHYAPGSVTADQITLDISYYKYDKDASGTGNMITTQIVLTSGGTVSLGAGAVMILDAGLTFADFDFVQTGVVVGDKQIINVKPKITIGDTLQNVQVKYGASMDISSAGTYPNTALQWAFNDDTLNNETTTMHFFTIDSEGATKDSQVALTVNGLGGSDTTGGTNHTTFTFAEGLGQVAELDTQLKDIDKFWDASGKFLLNEPQTLTLVQGNGKKALITLFNTDTIADVRDKLNTAIVTGLGQGEMVSGSEQDKFASYVTNADSLSVESTEGTFVLRSAQAGQDGIINVIGSETLINALGFNTVQEATESKFSVTVTDAHDSTNIIAEDVEISGNTLIGIVHQNVDVKFDANADINVNYNSTTKEFDLAGDNVNTYTTFVHLVDNSQVFQIGANEMQDMGAAIGRMDGIALGVNTILVTDRDSAGKAITTIDGAVTRVSAQRSSIGAVQNRLEHTINNLGVASENLTAAESRIRDVDMAAEMMDFSKTNVLSQASMAMLAQANQKPQTVMQLLQGS